MSERPFARDSICPAFPCRCHNTLNFGTSFCFCFFVVLFVCFSARLFLFSFVLWWRCACGSVCVVVRGREKERKVVLRGVLCGQPTYMHMHAHTYTRNAKCLCRGTSVKEAQKYFVELYVAFASWPTWVLSFDFANFFMFFMMF